MNVDECGVNCLLAPWRHRSSESKQPKSADEDLKNVVSTNNHGLFLYFRPSPIGRLGGDVP
jgi:hypothetical protein